MREIVLERKSLPTILTPQVDRQELNSDYGPAPKLTYYENKFHLKCRSVDDVWYEQFNKNRIHQYLFLASFVDKCRGHDQIHNIIISS